MDKRRCVGVVTYDLATGELHLLQAKAVLLATGGCGKIYRTTSNGNATTGEAFTLAYHLGIPLEDMEFVQFHPTGLYPLGILVSEAARGEGGLLRNQLGERFMERYAPTVKDLAARDVVSRAGKGGGLAERIMSILTSLILESKRFRKNSGKLPPLSESTQELIRSTIRFRWRPPAII
jgi:succinate dehydrogenase/fumarate reductase flavoprotein subunit